MDKQKFKSIIIQKKKRKKNKMQFTRAPRLVSVEQHNLMIIDTHGGIQDIVGIMTTINLARIHEKEIIGITCVGGKRRVEDAVTDALLAVKLCHVKIPIYKGANKPIMNRQPFPQTYNQSSNFDFIERLKKQVFGETISQQDLELIQQQSAARFIAESGLKYKQQLSVTTFGPLTNLAIAFQYQPKIKDIGNVSLLGGQYTGVGNVIGKYSAQANFHHDPQATHIIIHNFSHNLYITPIQRVLQIDWKQKLISLERSQTLDDHKKLLLNHLTKYNIVCLGPLLTILPVMAKKTLKKYYDVYSEICMDGNMIQGLLVINWFRLDVKEGEQLPNIKICCEYDIDKMKRELEKAWIGYKIEDLTIRKKSTNGSV